jgi:ankyrin repeat protein
MDTDTDTDTILKERKQISYKLLRSIYSYNNEPKPEPEPEPELSPILRLAKHDRPLYMYELLLLTGTNPNFYSEEGYWHSIKCFWDTDFQVCKLLIEYGANVDEGHVSHGPGVSYLATAVDEKNIEMVKLLLKHGATPYISTVREEIGNVAFFSRSKKITDLILDKMKKYNEGFIMTKDPNFTLKLEYGYGTESDTESESESESDTKSDK